MKAYAKFPTSAKFLTYYFLPVILLLSVKEYCLAITFLMVEFHYYFFNYFFNGDFFFNGGISLLF